MSGTSIATPHITAIAARLWEKDRTKSAQFIRGLIDISANKVGEKNEYGYGENVFYDNMKKTNYIASYILLTKIAVTFEKSSNYKDPTIVQGLSNEDYKEMCDGVDKNRMSGHDVNGYYIEYTWEYMLTRNDGTTKTKYEVSDHNKALLLYGMALHTATDTFSHSSHINGKLIRHTHNYDEIIGDADNETVVPNRYTCAKVLARRLLNHVKSKETGKTADWIITSNTYKGVFKLVGFSYFAKSVNATTYNDNKTEFDEMNLNFVDVKNN